MADKAHWAEGWVLLAVLYAGRAEAPADLATIVGAADHINHAILTRGSRAGTGNFLTGFSLGC